jgi:hypothetical protein
MELLIESVLGVLAYAMFLFVFLVGIILFNLESRRPLRTFIETLAVVALMVVVHMVVEYFMGDVTITATVNNEPVHCQVLLDGIVIGETPVTFDPSMGIHRMRILPPSDTQVVEAEVGLDIFTHLNGGNYDVPFHRRD